MDEETPFTVRDRRKFTAEGDLRDEAETAGATPEPAAEVPSSGEPAAREVQQPAAPDSAPAADAAARPEAAAGPESGVDLAGFLVSLASQAGMLLSTPEGDARENLQGAQHLIEVLEMLQHKTRGNRTEEEEQLLQQLLYELRMAFVERTRTVGA